MEVQNTVKSGSSLLRIQYLFTKMGESAETVNSFRALVEIRSKFVPVPKYLRLFIQEDGLKHLVIQLQKSETKIIDVSLSILGHCLLEQEPRVLVSYFCDLGRQRVSQLTRD